MRKYTINDLIEYAKSKGGYVKDSIYIGLFKKYQWECSQGHKFSAVGQIINRGSWCRKCAGLGVNNIEYYKKIAKMKGGKCLSDTYKNNRTKLIWECSQGHVWEAKPNSVQQGTWCPKCSGKQNLTISDCHYIAEKMGGFCLSTEYYPKKKMRWMCSQGHVWDATIKNIKYRNAWCSICAKNKLSVKFRREFEEIRIQSIEVANLRGGKFLGLKEAYVNRKSKLNWQCSLGHVWSATFENVVRNGTWCPECSTGLGERLTRLVFENLFSKKFPRIRPNWLRTSDGKLLELDGFNEELNLAFEHQGRQHYENTSFYSTNNRFYLDKIKKEICIKNGVDLIEIPEIITLTPIENLVEFILGEIKTTKKINFVTNIQYKLSNNDVYIYSKEKYAADLFDYAINKVKLNDFTITNKDVAKDGRIQITIQCINGHSKKYLISEIIREKLDCYHCNRNNKLNEEAILKLQEMNFTEISQEFWNDLNSKRSVFRYKCSSGHSWSKSRDQILRNKLVCNTCVLNNKKLADAISIVENSQIKIETMPHYRGKRHVFRLKCPNGHLYYRELFSVLQGKIQCNKCLVS